MIEFLGWSSLLAVSLFVLLQSAKQILRRVKKVSSAIGLSEIAVTLLVLSILASLPEFMVSVLAAWKGNSDVSLGTVIGSNIFTLLVVLGLAAVIRPFRVKKVVEERDSVWMILSGAVILIFIPEGISRWEGLFLVILYIPYIYSVYLSERKKTKKTSAETKRGIQKLREISLLLLLTLLMLFSAHFVLESGMKVAAFMHIPTFLMGLILMGIGTSIPETTIGITSALKKKADITLGDVYGTNIFTCLFILGISAVIHPIPSSNIVISFVLPFFIFSAVILQLLFSVSHRIGKVEGFLLIGTYLYFILANIDVLPKP